MAEDREPVVRITDGLGHDLPGASAEVSQKMLGWLDLEAAAGELSPGLAELRDLLRADQEEE